MINADALLNRLDGLKKTGEGKYLAKCPAHKDKSPSLSIKEIPGEKLLFNCFAGCSAESILAAVGIEWRDIYPARVDDKKERFPQFNTRELFPLLVQESLIALLAVQQIERGEPLTEHDIQRVAIAKETILNINTEYKTGKNGQAILINKNRIKELEHAKSYGIKE